MPCLGKAEKLERGRWMATGHRSHSRVWQHPCKISPLSCRRPGAHCRPLDPASLSLCSGGKSPKTLANIFSWRETRTKGRSRCSRLRGPISPFQQKSQDLCPNLVPSTAIMSSFIEVKLDNTAEKTDNSFMKAAQQQTSPPRNVTSTVRQRIEASGERVWRMTDFSGLSFPAVAQALSRLARQGQLRRLGKGALLPTTRDDLRAEPAQPGCHSRLAAPATCGFPGRRRSRQPARLYHTEPGPD